MQISILIVNYNTEQFITHFLKDLTQQTLTTSQFEIIITNNVQNNLLSSTIQQAGLNQLLNIKIIPSNHNIGFGRGMNLAAQTASGKHLLIANPDLRMLQNNYLEQLHTQGESHLNYGIMTTQLINDDGDDKSEFYGFEFHETFGYADKIQWFSGAVLLIRKEVFSLINGFDPDYFMYCEDEDLCLRIKQKNLTLIKINDLKIYHKGGASEPYQNYDFFYRWYRSQLLFAHKHFTEGKFNTLLLQLSKTAKWKVKAYKLLALLIPTARHRFQHAQWLAMYDIVHKTIQQSTTWLYFRI